MSFQIKDFRSIVTSMINVSLASQTKVTDFSVGSVARTLVESPAIEIEALYLQMLLGLMDAIPVSIYQAFDFPIVDARPSTGILTIHFRVPLPEPREFLQGGAFNVPSKSLVFTSTTSVTAPAGATSVDLMVACSTAGSVGNIAFNEITSIGSFAALPEGATLSNLSFANGRDDEGDLDRKARFAQYIASLSRGTVDSIRYCVSTSVVMGVGGLVQESVTRIGISEFPGFVNVYIYGSAGMPSQELMTQAQKLIDGYFDAQTGKKINGFRSAGVSVTVLPMVERSVPISVSVSTIYESQQVAGLISAIVSAISSVISAVIPGGLLRSDAVTGAVLPLPGVLSCLLGNDSNVLCGQFEILTPGAITVAWLPNA